MRVKGITSAGWGDKAFFSRYHGLKCDWGESREKIVLDPQPTFPQSNLPNSSIINLVLVLLPPSFFPRREDDATSISTWAGGPHVHRPLYTTIGNILIRPIVPT